MKSILLTGAAGFIGSHLAETLVTQGHRLRAFIHYNSRGDTGLLRCLEPRILKEIEIIPGDLADASAVHKAVLGCDTVFHLGAIVSVPFSYHNPDQVASANITGSLNVFLACREAGVERLLHTSAGEVYGTARSVPISEDHPLQAQSPYAASKIAADKLAESFYAAYGLPVVTVRPFSAFGPRQNARAIIPSIIGQVLTRPEVRLGSLESRRDFTYVADIVGGFLKAAQAPGVEGHVYNLGSSRECSVAQLLETILTLAPEFGVTRRPALAANPLRRGDYATGSLGGTGSANGSSPIGNSSSRARLYSDTTRAREELGWQARVSLEDGLRHTMAWVAAHVDQYRPGVGEF